MKFNVPDHVLEERIGDEVVLLSLKRETFFSLNASGIVLWTGMKAGRSAEELAGELANQYGLEIVRAVADVQSFVDELQKLELITPVSG
ncbi:MAG: PqqD family protein [Rhodanobacteraceae bacterium]|nr:PqqD family protein [Rhodanobacteraceae bacterium]